MSLVEVVEKWNSFSGKRNDLFGVFDILAVGHGHTLGVQVTSRSNMAARIKKIKEQGILGTLKEAGWQIVIHGWDKHENRWRLKEVTL